MSPRPHRAVSRAFTIVELLVVISIITVLVALIVPSFESAFDATKKAACAANLRGLGQMTNLYGQDNNTWIPTPTAWAYPDGTPEELWANWMAGAVTIPSDYFYGQGILWEHGYAKGAEKNYFCPSQSYAAFRLESYNSPTFPSKRTRSDGSQDWAIWSTYYYNPMTRWHYGQSTDSDKQDLQPEHFRLEHLSSNMLLGLDQLQVLSDPQGRLQGIPHAFDPGWNIMVGDTSVHYTVDPETEKVLFSNPGEMRDEPRFVEYQNALFRLLRGAR